MSVLLDTGELQGLNGTVSNLEQQSVNIRTVNMTIDEFKTGATGILAGDVWQKAGAKLSLYVQAMNKCCEAANALSQAIANAISSLMAVWDPRFGSTVDDQYRAETQAEYDRVSAKIAELSSQLDGLDTDTEEGAAAAYSIYAALQPLQAQLAEIDSLLTAIDTFLDEYHKQEEILKQLSSELDALSSAISGIAASDGFNYDSSVLANVDFSGFIGLDSLLTPGVTTPVVPTANYPEGYYGAHSTLYTGNNNKGTTFDYHILDKDEYDLVLQTADGLSPSNPFKTTSFDNLAAASGGEIVINAGRVERGPIYSGGEMRRSGGSNPVSDGGASLYYKDGTMGAVTNVDGKKYTGNDKLEEIDPDWACMGWFPTVVDGEAVPKEDYPATWNKQNITDYRNPLSYVGVTKDGDYIMGRTGGSRGDCEEQGVYPWDVAECLAEDGVDVDFLYILDGGGSVAESQDGEQIANTYDGRNLPTAIAAIPKEKSTEEKPLET